LNYTKGYGYIVELEKLTDEKNKIKETEFLKEKLKSLGIKITSKE
jgi:hypothetical protein